MAYRQCYRCGQVKVEEGEYERVGYWACDDCSAKVKAEMVEKTQVAERKMAELSQKLAVAEGKLADKEKKQKA